MHLLSAQQVGLDQNDEPVDLQQTPAECIILSHADSELACCALAHKQTNAPGLRLANLRFLRHPFSVDLYIEKTLTQAQWVIVRLLGGKSYWSYGCERLAEWAETRGAHVVFLPGDTIEDEELRRLSTVQNQHYTLLWQYFIHGGVDNARRLLEALKLMIAGETPTQYAQALPESGLYLPETQTTAPLSALTPKRDATRKCLLLFYRALIQSADLAVLDALCAGFHAHGFSLVPVFAHSLKSASTAAQIRTLIKTLQPDIVLNSMGFALSTPGEGLNGTALAGLHVPVMQILFASTSEQDWRESAQGLSASDLAMQVALPEIDGKVLSRAVSFKGVTQDAPWVEYQIIGHRPQVDRIDYCARLCTKWVALRHKRNAEKRLGIILAHYPNRHARMGNGVGLDTPQSVVNFLYRLQNEDYRLPETLPFSNGDGLIRHLQEGVNTVNPRSGEIRESLSLKAYKKFFSDLPSDLQSGIIARWGTPEEDEFYRQETESLAIGLFRLGNICIGLQPARGYQVNPQDSYHDPALVPPHGYLAFYAWLREEFDCDAIIQFGKHGNLEWLPGKALSLSKHCYPEAIHGAIPSIYPFIVNDPGEGTQAKRRTSSVIVDHLMPAMTRAGNEGEMGQLEMLVDEYFHASQTDPRRQKPLRNEILSLIEHWGIAEECGISEADDSLARLAKLDGYLCELKELQIRDGLHIFGQLASGESLTDLLVSLLRLPRGETPEDASLIQALAKDFALGRDFDPLDLNSFAKPWTDALPQELQKISPTPVRLHGDVRECLEIVAANVITGDTPCPGRHSAAVLAECRSRLLPLLQQSIAEETQHLLQALSGAYIPAGAAGAPTRNRWDVLPTGRNFYSMDSRALPTQAAWQLGWKSAALLLERHAQDHGDYPRTLVMSAWGTANMRTGGDDIAQAMAFIGAKPTWQQATGRVTGFEILPLSILDRPRVDVTLRISGFFRDAFPHQIALLDQAIRAIAALDEPEHLNPLAENSRSEKLSLLADGHDENQAQELSSARIYGAQPMTYGAGLQALMDSGVWRERHELAETFVRWGGFRYGAKSAGEEDFGGLKRRLQKAEVVSHNQDNREHDILDSDDYYQFQGGLTAAVAEISGHEPIVYHNDHSQPHRPQIRLLSEELARIVRARLTNPKWLRGMMRHGYKGAFEMSASIDYLFSYAATTHLVSDALFDAVARAYIDNDEVSDFLEKHNPDALYDIAARLQEALDRELWQPRANHHSAKITHLLGIKACINENDQQ